MALSRATSTLSILAATLMLLTGTAGLLQPSLYARETADWASQAWAQDLADVALGVPILLAGLGLSLRRSSWGPPLLGGALLYTAYTYVIYAFGVHFNPLFPAYCATLGCSAYALGLLALQSGNAEPHDGATLAPVTRGPGVTLIVLVGTFGLLWLAEDLPAAWRGTPPASLVAVGLPTNPVHVLDESLVLPALLVAGIRALRRQPNAAKQAAALLVFAALMGAAIVLMILTAPPQAGQSRLVPATVMTALTGLSACMFVRQLKSCAIRSANGPASDPSARP